MESESFTPDQIVLLAVLQRASVLEYGRLIADPKIAQFAELHVPKHKRRVRQYQYFVRMDHARHDLRKISATVARTIHDAAVRSDWEVIPRLLTYIPAMYDEILYATLNISIQMNDTRLFQTLLRYVASHRQPRIYYRSLMLTLCKDNLYVPTRILLEHDRSFLNHGLVWATNYGSLGLAHYLLQKGAITIAVASSLEENEKNKQTLQYLRNVTASHTATEELAALAREEFPETKCDFLAVISETLGPHAAEAPLLETWCVIREWLSEDSTLCH